MYKRQHQAYYGLSSVTLFIIGALVFFLPTGLVAAELASGWGQRGGIFRWVGEAMGPGLAFTLSLIHISRRQNAGEERRI